MKRALLILSAILGTITGSMAQVTDITVETFYTDNGTVAGYPAGHTTYRIYANTTNATDRVTVVSGNDNAPLILNVTGQGIWNHPNGGVRGDGAQCSIYSVIPAVEYDSYVTVGYTCDNDGPLAGLYSLEDSGQPWQTQMFNTSPYGAGSVTVNSVVGATWFALTDNANTEAGADNKILLAQITTDGNICGILNVQVFPNYAGPGSPYVVQTGLEFGNVDCGVPGCTDPAASNYDSNADFDNGLCIFPCALAVDQVTVTNPTCAGDTDGSVTVTGTGNQSFISYTFDGNDLGLADASGVEVTELGNGTYTVTLHDTRFDNEALNPGGIYGTCTVSQDITVNTDAVVMGASTSTNITCSGDNDGCVATDPANYGGGTGDLSFMIYTNTNQPVQDGDGNDLVLTTPDYCGLGGGTFHMVAMDANGCTANGPSFTVVNPSTLTLFEGAEQPATCFNSTDATQVITWAGGTGDVDFSTSEVGPFDIEGNPANLILSDLTPGLNTIYAQDENGCSASLEFSVAGGPSINIDPVVTSPACNGDSDGSISVNATGGTGDLTYSFDCVNFDVIADLTDLIAGTYTVCVQDANGCIASEDVEVTEPAVLGSSSVGVNILCFGDNNGSITIAATGGTEPYAYSINGIDYVPSPDFGDLGSGVYDTYVMDANGCQDIQLAAQEITEPEELLTSVATTDELCFEACNGTLTMTTTGGTGQYFYAYNDGPVSATNPIENLCPGVYSVIAYDENGCETSIVPDLTVGEATQIVISGLAANPINEDPGGNTTYTVEGGTEPYSYEWTDSDGTVVTTNMNLPSLGAGQDDTYTLTVTDDNGCEVTTSINVTGIGEFGQEFSFTLYPNPNNGEFVISIVGLKGEKMNYSVVDAAGRVVMAKELGNVNGTRLERIDMKDAAVGFYSVQFVMGGQTHNLHFVKN
ncbi:MAG: T9SS type A sorting domain-containing protein [Flavobacteriales bacterium]|nr:T9SS type A sorting domain-containing protein [Flavobacteriales bacterium]